jgi:hypothetical protein
MEIVFLSVELSLIVKPYKECCPQEGDDLLRNIDSDLDLLSWLLGLSVTKKGDADDIRSSCSMPTPPFGDNEVS